MWYNLEYVTDMLIFLLPSRKSEFFFCAMTYSFGQCILIRVIRWSALLYLFQQQRVFDQTAAGEIQEVPQVQFAAEGRLLTQTQEMLHSFLLLLLIQQGFGPHLVTAVCHIGFQARELWRVKWQKRIRSKHPHWGISVTLDYWETRHKIQEVERVFSLTQLSSVGPTSPTVFSDPLSRSRRPRRSSINKKPKVSIWLFLLTERCCYSAQTGCRFDSFNFLYR